MDDQHHCRHPGTNNATLRIHLEFRRATRGSLTFFNLGPFSLEALRPFFRSQESPQERVSATKALGIRARSIKGAWQMGIGIRERSGGFSEHKYSCASGQRNCSVDLNANYVLSPLANPHSLWRPAGQPLKFGEDAIGKTRSPNDLYCYSVMLHVCRECFKLTKASLPAETLSSTGELSLVPVRGSI